MKKKILAAAAALALGAPLAHASEIAVSQRDKAFDQTSLEAHVGDTVVFTNEDTITHNVLAAKGPNKFNLGSMRPGAAADVTLKAAGEVEVRCAIHPKMKLTINVTE